MGRLAEIKKEILAVRKDLNAGRIHHDERETVSELLESLAHVVLKLEAARAEIEELKEENEGLRNEVLRDEAEARAHGIQEGG